MRVVRVEGVEKRFGRGRSAKVALAGLSLEVERGTAFGLLGPNGAGKTTLLKVMLGAARATRGTVEIFGLPPSVATVRARVGYLPERLALPPSWTPMEWLTSVARLKRLGQVDRDQEALLARVGLEGVRRKKIGTFSKGMRQRLGLATALVGQPDLLVLDEPTDGIDPRGRVEVRRILEEERKRGATIFLNSHLLSETERICDVVGILDQGSLVTHGRTLDLCGAPNRWRARLQGAKLGQFAAECGLIASDEAGVYEISAPSVAELNHTIDRMRRQDVELVELTRTLRSLEDVLLEVTAERRTGEHD